MLVSLVGGAGGGDAGRAALGAALGASPAVSADPPAGAEGARAELRAGRVAATTGLIKLVDGAAACRAERIKLLRDVVSAREAAIRSSDLPG